MRIFDAIFDRITDNREVITVALIVLAVLLFAAGFGTACRGGAPWAGFHRF